MSAPLHDIDRKKIIKNGWRVTSDRAHTCLRIRVPGGHLEARHLPLLQKIATELGNGTLHLTTRQGFEIPGIAWEHMPAVNALIAPLIECRGAEPGKGYPAAGTRNIAACIGSRVCPFANTDTTALAHRIEELFYPHDFHFKIAVTGCPNDCIKAHLHDFGIIATTVPCYDAARCISCSACVDACKKRVTAALTLTHDDVVRDTGRCIGCGECVKVCPTRAITRSDEALYRMVIMGRTGRKNPRLAAPFLKWASEAVVLAVIKNTYAFVERYIDRTLPKEHIGYIVDRVGFETFKSEVLGGVALNPQLQIARVVEWHGYTYDTDRERF